MFRLLPRSSTTISSMSISRLSTRSFTTSISRSMPRVSSFSPSNPISLRRNPVTSSTLSCSHIRRFTTTTSTSSSTSTSTTSSTPNPTPSPNGGSGSSSEIPPGRDRGIARWLFGVAGLVAGMVVIGGLTRLTKSGLSMVEWKPTSVRPPMSHDEWVAEFEKYKQFPEYKYHSGDMTLSDFKYIYYWEWSHRVLGRIVGVAFILPYIYFVARGRIRGKQAVRLGLIGALGGAQGAIGWWMVRSGLEPSPQQLHQQTTVQHKEVRVSPYRLTTHLVSAFLIYGLLVANGLRYWHGQPTAASVAAFQKAPIPKQLRILSVLSKIIISLTIVSGAFVAGNQAGMIYNEFPYMGNSIIPSDYFDPYLSRTRNLFENSSAVQFNHRWLGITTASIVAATWIYGSRIPLPPQVRLPLNMLALVTAGQVGLGITTLLYGVPTHLAATHQSGALTLFTVALWFLHALSRGRIRAPPTTTQKVAAAVFPVAAITSSSSSSSSSTATSSGIPDS